MKGLGLIQEQIKSGIRPKRQKHILEHIDYATKRCFLLFQKKVLWPLAVHIKRHLKKDYFMSCHQTLTLNMNFGVAAGKKDLVILM